jgi:hypothetical protein
MLGVTVCQEGKEGSCPRHFRRDDAMVSVRSQEERAGLRRHRSEGGQ